jgi:hypothetical protein
VGGPENPRVKIEPAAVEVDGMSESLAVSECVRQPIVNTDSTAS